MPRGLRSEFILGTLVALGLAGCPAGDDDRRSATAPAEEQRQRPADLLTPEEARVTGPGNWRRARSGRTEDGLTEAQRQEIERLEAVGYVTGSREALAEGVTIHQPGAVQAGLNFYTSGHAPEAILTDMEGKELHRWRYEFSRAFPRAGGRLPSTLGMQWWCGAHLFENGDVLAIFGGEGIIKLDARSQLIWARRIPAHHDLAVLPDGDIYVLTRKAHVVPRIRETQPILEDFITRLDSDGTVEASFSLVEAFERSEFDWIFELPVPEGFEGDIFHTNALELLDGRIADRVGAFKEGHLLVSICTLGTIAVVDPRTERVVWAHRGGWGCQHDPQVLDEGTVLLFDNSGLGSASRVLELDPVSLEIVWEYRGTGEHPFFSQRIGGAQRLSNSNTLITESEGGRAFEVTPDQEIAWQFYTPHRTGDHREFIATLCRMRRLPQDFSPAWLSDVSPGD